MTGKYKTDYSIQVRKYNFKFRKKQYYTYIMKLDQHRTSRCESNTSVGSFTIYINKEKDISDKGKRKFESCHFQQPIAFPIQYAQ